MKYLTDDGELLDENCEDCVIFFKTPNNHNTLHESMKGALVCEEPSKTDQSLKEDADINVIIDRIKKGAQYDIPLPEHFGIDDRIDLLEARTRIAESNATFYNLAPDIRSEFLNDPARWEEQVTKDLHAGNTENLKRMGIDITKKPVAPPVATPAPAAPVEGGVPPGTPPNPPIAPSGGD